MSTRRTLGTITAHARRRGPVLLTAVVAAASLAMAPSAMAQKKKDEGKAAAAEVPKPTKAYMPIALQAEAALKAKDWATLSTVLAQGRSAATEPVDQYWQGYFMLQQSLGMNDVALQGQALEMILASGLTPKAQAPTFTFAAGKIAYSQKDYAKALTRFEAARALGVTDPELALLTSEAYFAAGRVDEGVNYARAMIAADKAAGRKTPERVFVNAARALQSAGRTSDMMAVLTDRVATYPTRDVWNATLRMVLQTSPDDKDLTLDVMRLMAATGSFKERNEYLEYAMTAGDRGLPGEVVAAVEAARAAGLARQGDVAFDELYTVRKAKIGEDRGSLAASARSAAASAQPRIAVVTGDAYLTYKDYANAIAMYDLARTKTGADMNLIGTRLGIAKALSGDTAGALAAFDTVTGVRAPIATLWKVHLNSLAATPAPTATTSPAS